MSDTWAPAFYTFHISPAFNFPSLKSHIVRSGKHLFEVFSGREFTGGKKTPVYIQLMMIQGHAEESLGEAILLRWRPSKYSDTYIFMQDMYRELFILSLFCSEHTSCTSVTVLRPHSGQNQALHRLATGFCGSVGVTFHGLFV